MSPPVKEVTDLLADQPEEALLRMKERVHGELARLTVEALQIDEALAKQARRKRGRSGGGSLSREKVFELVKAADQPLTSAEVHKLVLDAGITASLNSVRNHLARLVDQNGWLGRTADGRFTTHFSGEEPADPPLTKEADGADDDIPF